MLYESPLVTYITIPAEIVHIARTEYSLMHTVRGTHGRARSAVYDLHDAFFLPVSRFTTILRSGPNIRIYTRRDLPPLQSQSQQDATAAPPVGSEPGEDVLYRLQATARSARSPKPEDVGLRRRTSRDPERLFEPRFPAGRRSMSPTLRCSRSGSRVRYGRDPGRDR